MKYDTAEYAESRLNGTMVMGKEGPVTVISIDELFLCDVVDTISGKRHKVKLDELDLTPVKLGYVNTRDRGALYVVRMPKRNDWRQGLRRENMIVLSRPMDPGKISQADLSRCIIGDYPKFEEAVNIVSDDFVSSIAWSRDFAITFKGKVLYRTIHVGNYDKDAGVVLLEDFSYLQEVLNESK